MQINIPPLTAAAEPLIPILSTERQRYSNPKIKTDIMILSAILLLIFPQIRKKLSTAKVIVVNGDASAYTR
ncbi:MAG: hypothetical protein ACLVG9_07245, partial [Eubacteriales bacterium]